MKKEINWIERRKRNYLKEVLPLDTPYTIILEPIKACNFKCVYCVYSSSKIKSDIMSLELFKKAISGLDRFSKKLKTFQFTGLGEPLLNKDIYKMIDLVKNYAEFRTILTNGALLNIENIDKLLNTTLNEIRISLQGITEEDYYKTCGYKINLNNFLTNLSYLYKNRGDKKIYLKIPDIAINTDEKKEKFFELFEDKADYIIIQKISPLHSQVNYSNIIDDYSKTQYFEDVHRIKVCHQPFMMMQILSNGDVSPCCALDINKPIIGNINNNDIYDIWNGNEMKKFRLIMLEDKRNTIKVCEQCGYPEYQYNQYDDIDNERETLLRKYL